MDTLRWRVGDATVLRIAELDATAALQGLIPKFDLADVARAEWLIPDFVDEDGQLRGLVQAFVIMIADQVIIVDPGVGNGKKRSAVPGRGNLHTDFLDRLGAGGVALNTVNYVVNTHLPGHTPHHVCVMIESRGQSAVFAGDVMHHPCQIAYPDWGASSDFNPDQARASRSDVLKWCAKSDTLLLGAHFADPVAGRITANGSGFRLVPIAA
jgi:glyoxylase-like metal-dependent hydrolase (beta-lactamase superfamily II)